MFKLSPRMAYCRETGEFVYITSKVSKEDVKNVKGMEAIAKRMSPSTKAILIRDETASNCILVFVKFKDIGKLIEKYKMK